MKKSILFLLLIVAIGAQGSNPKREIRQKCRKATRMSNIKEERKMIRKSKRIELKILREKKNMSCVTYPPRVKKNLPTRLNNPGALRNSSNPKVMQYADGFYKTEKNGKFLKFKMAQHGYFALQEVIRDAKESTIESFISRYAPKKQGEGNAYGNNTKDYIASVVSKLGVTTQTKVGDCNEFLIMHIISKKEGFERITSLKK